MAATLLLVDGSSYLYRAFYAMTHLSSPSGVPTNAVYGVLNMLRRLRAQQPHDFCACVFDAKGKNFRHQLFPEYKATRPPMPDDLRPQAEMLPELVELLGWKVLKIDGVEADDVIGTLAVGAARQGLNVVISTGDKDMAQLVGPQISLVDTMKNEILDEAGVLEKFGVRPAQIRDYLALVGDKVDNVPGVEKCGPKTAVKWLEEYGTLVNIVAKADNFKGKVGENLRAALPQLPLAYKLVSIKMDVDLSEVLPQGLADLQRREPDWRALIPRFRELGFNTWLQEAQQDLMGDLLTAVESKKNTSSKPEMSEQLPEKNVVAKPDEIHYQIIRNENQWNELYQQCLGAKRLALSVQTDTDEPMKARLIGLALSLETGKAFYLPVAHALNVEQLDFAQISGSLKNLLADEKIGKVAHNMKFVQHVFANHGLTLSGVVDDAMLASYVVESHLKHHMSDLAGRWLDETVIEEETLRGKGGKRLSFADLSVEDVAPFACQQADFAGRLATHLRTKMTAEQLRLYEQIELPVSQILWEMERVGVHIDRKELSQQSIHLGEELLELEEQAFEFAGQPFNLNSPKQLQEILFNKLGMPTKGVKKTATGGYSTDEQVLEKLADDYRLPKIILQHRSLAKLKSTYTDKLPEMINTDTGRVHTTYAQAVAVTGRLASNNPNLQNIPIRTKLGRKVRRAFNAQENYVMLSADYSQIELRIMAHLSGDETLLQSFKNQEDVHRRTAAEVFGVPPENISNEQRRYAKTINFGLIYGMSEYGLAKALGIDAASAKMFIQRYFARYTGVADYMQRAKEQAQSMGYVETLFGRRLYLPDIFAKSANVRAAAERAAINAPMQGTASDLIKLAMIDVAKFLHSGSLKSRLVMQVHDELVLEVFEPELTLLKVKLPEIMGNIGADKLAVPLLAEVGVGNNWDDAH